jgi:hypothetical protein
MLMLPWWGYQRSDSCDEFQRCKDDLVFSLATYACAALLASGLRAIAPYWVIS